MRREISIITHMQTYRLYIYWYKTFSPSMFIFSNALVNTRITNTGVVNCQLTDTIYIRCQYSIAFLNNTIFLVPVNMNRYWFTYDFNIKFKCGLCNDLFIYWHFDKRGCQSCKIKFEKYELLKKSLY